MIERRREALFRFDPQQHEYYDLSGRYLPHITGMLKLGGWIDDEWFTEESSIRGTAVHDLTSEYDMGALDPDACISAYRSYLLAHVEAMQRLRPDWIAIEEATVHPAFRFGGRPDRIGRALNRMTVLEIKTGGKSRAVGIQLALQAILAPHWYPLPPDHWVRLGLFLRPCGSFSLDAYEDRRDFDEAYRLIKTYCGRTDGFETTAVRGESAPATTAAPARKQGRGKKSAAVPDRRRRHHDRAAHVAVPTARRAARGKRVVA